MKKLDQKGIGAIAVLLIIVIVAMIAGVGWYVWQARQESNELSNSTETVETERVPETAPIEMTGTFQGVAPKTGSGGATVVKESDGTQTVRLHEDFAVQDGPALFVAFANDGTYADGTAFAELKSFTGAQEYTVPADIDISQYNQVMIWCEEFTTAFSVADIQ